MKPPDNFGGKVVHEIEVVSAALPVASCLLARLGLGVGISGAGPSSATGCEGRERPGGEGTARARRGRFAAANRTLSRAGEGRHLAVAKRRAQPDRPVRSQARITKAARSETSAAC